MTRRAVDFITEWLAHNLASSGDTASLAGQLEVDAAVVGITRSEIEEDTGPLEEFVARAGGSLAEARSKRGDDA